MDFPDRLQSLIGERSLHAFAREVGVPDPTLRSCFRRRSVPRMDVVVQIASETGVSVEWLATGKGPKRISDEDIRSRVLELLDHPEIIESLPLHPTLRELAASGRKTKSRVTAGLITALVQALEASGMHGPAEWLLLGRNATPKRVAGGETAPVSGGSLIPWIKKQKLDSNWASRVQGYRELRHRLTKGEVDPNRTGTDGVTPLMEAARGPSGDPALVQILIEHGADVQSRDNYQNTALILAVSEQSGQLEENIPCIGVLLRAGADPLDSPSALPKWNCLSMAKDRKMRLTALILEDCLRDRAYQGILKAQGP